MNIFVIVTRSVLTPGFRAFLRITGRRKSKKVGRFRGFVAVVFFHRRFSSLFQVPEYTNPIVTRRISHTLLNPSADRQTSKRRFSLAFVFSHRFKKIGRIIDFNGRVRGSAQRTRRRPNYNTYIIINFVRVEDRSARSAAAPPAPVLYVKLYTGYEIRVGRSENKTNCGYGFFRDTILSSRPIGEPGIFVDITRQGGGCFFPSSLIETPRPLAVHTTDVLAPFTRTDLGGRQSGIDKA